MQGVLLSEIVLVDEGDCFEILLGELAFPWGSLFLLHEVDAEKDAAVSAHHIVEVLPGCYAHVIGVSANWVSREVRSIAGLGLTILGFCIQ